MTLRTLHGPGGAFMALVVACTACSSGAPGAGDVRSSSSSVPSSSSSASPHGHRHPATADAMSAASPQEVRLLLEKLLGHHAILMIRLMRGSIDGEAEFVDAADDALKRNTRELRAAVDLAYGDAAARSFSRLWTEHVSSLTAYSRARAREDRPGMRAAMADLDEYADRYGVFISKLTSGSLPPGAVAGDVAAHIHHLVDAVDAYADDDYLAAYEDERTAYAAMFSTGKALSGAAVASKSGELPAGFASPPSQLRSALGRLLGEHVELAFDATRAVVTGSPSAEAAAGALNANTEEIIAAMQAALGAADAEEFSRMWAAHIDALVTFAVAVADGDDEAQARARARLDTFPRQLGALLPGVSGGQVPADTVIAALREHDLQLMQQVTAYAAKDYSTSHNLAYEGYDHMFAIADVLADVLVGRVGATAPLGGAGTGGGGAWRP